MWGGMGLDCTWSLTSSVAMTAWLLQFWVNQDLGILSEGGPPRVEEGQCGWIQGSGQAWTAPLTQARTVGQPAVSI